MTIFYSECYGPEYHSLAQLRRWFEDWHKRGQVLAWDISRIMEFPNQDTIPSGGFGNLIALPLQKQAVNKGNSVFVDEHFIPYRDQWAYLSTLTKIDEKTVDGLIEKLCAKSELGELYEERSDKPWEIKLPDNADDVFPQTHEIVLSNMLYIPKQGVSQSGLNKLKRLACFKNPEFYKAQAIRMSTYNKPRMISLADETDEYIMLPRGCREALEILLAEHNCKLSVRYERARGRRIDVSFNGELRPDQQEAVKLLTAYDNGVLAATTAFGKTVTAIGLIAERRINTLVLVHTQALLQQWKKSLEQFLTVNEVLPEQPAKRGRKKKQSAIGQLGGAKNALSGIVDIAVMQSLFTDNEVRPLVNDVRAAVENGRTPIIISERMSHIERLAEQLSDAADNVIILSGRGTAKEKKALLEKVGSIPKTESLILLATGKYAGEGFDEPRLDTLFLAMPISWSGTLSQYVGRLHRKYEGKSKAVIYDYIDINVQMLENMYKKRLRGYAKLGYAPEVKDESSYKTIYTGSCEKDMFKDMSAAKMSVIIASAYIPSRQLNMLVRTAEELKLKGAVFEVVSKKSDSIYFNKLERLFVLHGIKYTVKNRLGHSFAVIDSKTVWYSSGELFGSDDDNCVLRIEDEVLAGELAAYHKGLL